MVGAVTTSGEMTGIPGVTRATGKTGVTRVTEKTGGATGTMSAAAGGNGRTGMAGVASSDAAIAGKRLGVKLMLIEVLSSSSSKVPHLARVQGAPAQQQPRRSGCVQVQTAWLIAGYIAESRCTFCNSWLSITRFCCRDRAARAHTNPDKLKDTYG